VNTLDKKHKDIWVMQGCCLDRLKEVPDNSVDLVLCDPPYGTTRNKWDSVIDLTRLWKELKRVSKDNTAICLMAQTPFDKVLGVSNLAQLKYEYIWVKNKASGHLNAKKMPLKNHENVLVFYKKLPTYNPQKTTGNKNVSAYTGNRKRSSNYGLVKEVKYEGGDTRYPLSAFPSPVINNDGSSGDRIHPTQKPEELMEFFIKTYSNPGDVVLDFAFGAGTSLKAAIRLSRKVIGVELGSCEKEGHYYYGWDWTDVLLNDIGLLSDKEKHNANVSALLK
jgi:DNA modification methylase